MIPDLDTIQLDFELKLTDAFSEALGLAQPQELLFELKCTPNHLLQLIPSTCSITPMETCTVTVILVAYNVVAQLTLPSFVTPQPPSLPPVTEGDSPYVGPLLHTFDPVLRGNISSLVHN